MTDQNKTTDSVQRTGLAGVAGSENKLPRWVKVHRVFLLGPRRMKDTKRLRWLCRVWEIEDSGMEEFLGLLPEYEYFESEAAAWADLFPNT